MNTAMNCARTSFMGEANMPTKTEPSQGAKEAAEKIVAFIHDYLVLAQGQGIPAPSVYVIKQIIEDCTLAGEMEVELRVIANFADEHCQACQIITKRAKAVLARLKKGA
jgi:hypothetical protein